MLWMPSWGGMINGLLTLRGAWHKVHRGSGPQVLRRRRHLLRHVHLRGAAALDQERQRALALHRLDHRPRPRRRARLERLHGLRHDLLARAAPLPDRARGAASWPRLHFWIGTVGILLYIVAIYVAGLTQGLMWRAFDETGRLAYPDFVETTVRLIPMYWVRVLGGSALPRRRRPVRRQRAHDLAAGGPRPLRGAGARGAARSPPRIAARRRAAATAFATARGVASPLGGAAGHLHRVGGGGGGDRRRCSRSSRCS